MPTIHMLMRRALQPIRSWGLIASVPIVAACGDDAASVDQSPLVVSPAAATALTAGAGATLENSLRVRVTRREAPSAGVVVAWTTSDGSVVTPSSGVTDADGIATASWNVGTTRRTVRARATVEGGGSPVEFSAVVTAGPPATVSAADPATVAGIRGVAMTEALRVRVSDAFGNAVEGARIAWTSTAGAAIPSPSVTTSDATGIARASVNLPDVGSSTIRAALEGSPAIRAEFTIASLAAASAEVSVTVSNTFFQPASVTIPVNGLVRWTLQNTTGVAHFIVSSGSPSFASPQNSLMGDGSSFQFVFAVPGTYRYECTLHAGMTGTVLVQ